jgi:tetratricopeptide (TPR) repeat protein
MAGLLRLDLGLDLGAGSMKQTVPSQPAADAGGTAKAAPSIDVGSLVAEAVKLHRAGQLDAAARLYQQVLSAKPDDFDALHLLGVVFHQCGQHVQAIRQIEAALAVSPDDVVALSNRGGALMALQRFQDALAGFDRAIALKPDYVEAWINRGNALFGLGRCAEAVASYDRAHALRPDHAEALSNRGSALNALGRYDEAVASCDRALALRPDYAEALLNRGNALKELKRFDEALQNYDRALAVQPDYVEALCNRAVVLCEFKRYAEALASCDRAIGLRPGFADAHCNRGNALHGLERFAQALESYDRALALRPDFVEAHVNRGIALHALKRPEAALANYDQALTRMPDHAETLYNRGNVLYALNRFDEAIASYDRAVALRPDYAEAFANRGVTLNDVRRFDDALASYERARAARPDFVDAHYNEALCRLLSGDLRQGFEKFEWRWETEPLWTGAQDIAGKTVLLHAEQGFGDTIQFCRYAPLVAARGARVVLEVPEPLRALMAGLPGIAQILARGEPVPSFELHCPLLTLPLSFATELASIPSATPYLHAAVAAVANWRNRLGGSDLPRIGIAWSGRLTHKNDHNRSLDLATFLRIFARGNATIVSVQREVRGADAATLRARDDIVHFGEELRDFSDTAALIANLDLVIAVDTSVVHLAGALGKPVWVLLPFIPDWRWLLDRDDSPWYPTARLFRQDESRRWDGVIGRVSAALDEQFADRQ